MSALKPALALAGRFLIAFLVIAVAMALVLGFFGFFGGSLPAGAGIAVAIVETVVCVVAVYVIVVTQFHRAGSLPPVLAAAVAYVALVLGGVWVFVAELGWKEHGLPVDRPRLAAAVSAGVALALLRIRQDRLAAVQSPAEAPAEEPSADRKAE